LVAPIALYPDPLLAVLLPASTFPDQVQACGQFLAANPTPSDADISAQPWDPSVQALAHYPAAVQQLNSDPQWLQSLGSAYANQSSDVMAAIQDMRAQAASVGNLATNAQVEVVHDGATIAIEPVDENVVYVPTYDPTVVYVSPFGISWGVGFGCGVWLNEGIAWDGGFIFVGGWHDGWIHGPGGWHRDFGFHPGARWARDARWGRAPGRLSHYAIRRDVHADRLRSIAHSRAGESIRRANPRARAASARPGGYGANRGEAGRPGNGQRPDQQRRPQAGAAGGHGDSGGDDKKH
jgi:hypothetical protein